MINLVLSALLLASSAFAGEHDKKVIVKKVIVGDQSEDININVDAQVEDGVCTIVITRDGETSEFSFDIEDENAISEIEEKIEAMGIDVHVKALAFGEDSKFIIDAGSSDAAFLGVHIQDLTEQLRKYFKVEDESGVLVSEVVEDSPAEKGKVKAGDIIIKVEDQPIDGPRSLQRIIRSYKPKDKVKLTLKRNGRKKTISITLGEQENTFSWRQAIPGDDHKMMFFDMERDNHDFDDPVKKHFKIMKKHEGGRGELQEDLKSLRQERSEERRVGKECRSRWSPYH